ncbi:hypothetical protein PHJA_002100100 [Phtheirospermum japonicum]|uniref:Uncharacterized protein n=1 Tax=Phtheirospermum japonicum TaxID=374723 RepID=A0A830CIJ4_9LAMI|nr:hypothetical protein PHJA_002100100 [Phtheirospermum japonicum]
MASTCISSCVDDARVPVRATYVNLYKWPESDFEFVRSMSSKKRKDEIRGPTNLMYGQPRVVDSISCRQLYLRSYTFSREEDYRDDKDSTMKCLGRKNNNNNKENIKNNKKESRKRKSGLKRAKDVSCSALASIFRRLLSCTTKVDVAN